MIVIRDFRVGAGDYQRMMWRLFFGRWWPWLVLPLAAAAAMLLAGVDVRWLLAALMLVCLAFPMILVLVYINYALTIEARWSLMEKTARLDTSGIHLTFTDERMRPRTIRWADVTHITRDSRAYYLHLRARRYTFLAIPSAALTNQHINQSDLIALFQVAIAK